MNTTPTRPARPYAKKNALGYWVGCLEYRNGVHAEVTNAFDHEYDALEIAERMADVANQNEIRNVLLAEQFKRKA